MAEVQKDFMPEDTEAGMIIGFLETYQGNQVCSKQLYREALHHEYDEPKRWQIRCFFIFLEFLVAFVVIKI